MLAAEGPSAQPAVQAGADGSRPLRVALAVGSLAIGGAEKQVVGVARRLRSAGVDVEVVLLTGGGALRQRLDDGDVPVYEVGLQGVRNAGSVPAGAAVTAANVRRLITLAAHLRRRRFDVLHAFLFHAYALLVPLALLLGVPVRIAARRGLHESLPEGPLITALTRVSTWCATAVVANAQAVAEDAHRSERVPRAKLRVIPNGVDLPAEQADPGAEPATGLMIANLIPYKGHVDVVEALALVEDPPVIRCVGEGPARTDVEQAIVAHGLEDVVLLEGSRPEARRLYADCQFALLASHAEGMPNAVLEAMAAGLPVVATDVGGCRELVTPGVTGWLVPAARPEALAEALRLAAGNAGLRAEMGAAARARAASFSWEACAAAHLDCYRELLASASPRRVRRDPARSRAAVAR